jgi:hypothetical protein
MATFTGNVGGCEDGAPSDPLAGVCERLEADASPSSGLVVVPFAPCGGDVLRLHASACRCAWRSRGTGAALLRRFFAGEHEALSGECFSLPLSLPSVILGLGFQLLFGISGWLRFLFYT